MLQTISLSCHYWDRKMWSEQWSENYSLMSDSLWLHGLYCSWISPGQNTGVDNLSLLHGIFPTQGLNPGLPHCRQILCQLSYKGSPRTLEWVAYPFSSKSRPRNWTEVSCISDGFFTNWAIRATLLATNFRSQITLISVRSGTKENVKIKNRSNPLKREQRDYSKLFH